MKDPHATLVSDRLEMKLNWIWRNLKVTRWLMGQFKWCQLHTFRAYV